MKEFIKISKAISDITRLKMLKIMEEKELCVCEIQSVFNFAQPTISKHLKVLENAGLVKSNKKGLWVYYSLNTYSNSKYIQTTLSNIKSWFNEDNEIIKAKKNIKFTCQKD